MHSRTKRRIGAYIINQAVYLGLSVVIEKTVLRRVKSEVIHAVVTQPTISFLGEIAQLKLLNGKSIGGQICGIQVEDKNGLPLTTKQVVRRTVYRDTVSLFKIRPYWKPFLEDGQRLPEDDFAQTIVRTKEEKRNEA
ncbi:RDD family protein [Exiguobacterium acetylicum]|uniref:RDD family protein n=1 Tax=Exiguobacterium acetylicum TaxID=41170 RepID=UPI001EE38117|nr:RDD family protein [Exiguobacterium acetylicum]UKS54749.1 RDD family protein [Exiguobacterium acetylicum]